MLQVRKVIEHLYEKVIGQGSDGGSQTASNTSANASGSHVDKADRDDDFASIADEKVELLCNDQVLPPEEIVYTHTHTHVYRPFFQDYVGEERKCGGTSASRDENGQVDVWR